ncbi:hypothetical protein KFE94_17215 [bacterium SCSIO 12643]|nr:hypothetical protein KFE94_17215 [bacterium SCSIO 12643]
MTNKDLIVRLIQQDLKHNQLTARLRKAGLEGDEVFYLGILEIVSDLMGVPRVNDIEERWSDIYISFMNDVVHFEISGRSDSYKPLAEMCYIRLKSAIEFGQNMTA